MLLNDKPCGQRPNTHVRIEALKLVYEIFNVKMMTEMDIQSFFFLMKRASEDLGCPVHELREPGDEEEYEEYVDVAVCK